MMIAVEENSVSVSSSREWDMPNYSTDQAASSTLDDLGRLLQECFRDNDAA
jgi:hypothetical protein